MRDDKKHSQILNRKVFAARNSNNFWWLSFCPNGSRAFLFILTMQKLALKYLSSLFHISPFSQSCFHFCLLKVASAAEPHCHTSTLISLQYLLPSWYLPNVLGANVVIKGLINGLLAPSPVFDPPMPNLPPPPYPCRDWNWTFLDKIFTTVCCPSRSRLSDAFNLPSFQ